YAVKSTVRVASPPAKPLMVYDGDCNFCKLWIRRWQCATGDRVEYLPSQDPRISAQFPEIDLKEFETAVQLITPDGSVYIGAEVVFRVLAFDSHQAWLLEWYGQSPLFVRVTDGCYHFVAKHRMFFSWLTRLLWGRNVLPPSYLLVRRIFL